MSDGLRVSVAAGLGTPTSTPGSGLANDGALRGPPEKPRIINLAPMAETSTAGGERTPRDVLIRPSATTDLDALTAIYRWNVANGTGTFELEAPDRDEMSRRRDAVLANGLPWLVLESAGRVAGYAYANHFRPRPAYRFCVEDSVYLAGDAAGKGFGRLLLAELLARCEAAGARQMLAVIGDAQNAPSIGVHRALGFEQVGVLKSSGWKFGRWLDVVIMQKALGFGDTETPPE